MSLSPDAGLAARRMPHTRPQCLKRSMAQWGARSPPRQALVHEAPPVNHYHLPRHESTVVRHQEDQRARHVLWIGLSLDGPRRRHPKILLPLGQDALAERVARSDGIHPDAKVAKLSGQRPRKGREPLPWS